MAVTGASSLPRRCPTWGPIVWAMARARAPRTLAHWPPTISRRRA